MTRTEVIYTEHLEAQVTRFQIHSKQSGKLLDRLLTCVPSPDSDGYKLAEIMKIAEEWQRIR